MPKFFPDENSWPLYQAVGTWTVAIGLLIYEAIGRHFVDQGGLAILAGLLGLPVIINVERQRRGRNGS